MELIERIHNIKELLSYCDHTEIPIRDEKSRKFLFKFFTENDKFAKPYHWYDEDDRIADAEIHMFTAYLNEDKIYPLRIGYMTNYQRDDEDWAHYMFTDDEVTYEYEWMKPKDNLRYSDFPDWFWETLQNNIFETIKGKLLNNVQTSKEYYLHKAKEAYEENLKIYNNIIRKYGRKEEVLVSSNS